MKKLLGVLMMVMAIIGLTMLPEAEVMTANASNGGTTEIKDTVQSADIVFGGGDLYVEVWEKEHIGFKVEKGQNSNGYEYECYVKDNVIYVEGSQKSGHSANKGDNKVYLYIPSDMKFENFILVNGNADVYASNVVCERLQIDAAVGTINITDFEADDVSVVMGMGTINADGKITGDVDVLCNAGTVNVKLTGNVSDHDYLIDTTLGKVKVGNTTYGVMSKKKITNNTGSMFDLECVAGLINFEFNAN
ncbi:DUF4097 family beta strand repeat-containing protein [Candidatus Merdisoma sp. JLR.KK006]|jgi:hypothetical protein|uniref:DUF4097 family beta strand repeat-containing protein n=1 Tax=Candidatus Merdisoma sp. JLR.KK006 TaxID=3112626 RepID=UPI002FF087D2